MEFGEFGLVFEEFQLAGSAGQVNENDVFRFGRLLGRSCEKGFRQIGFNRWRSIARRGGPHAKQRCGKSAKRFGEKIPTRAFGAFLAREGDFPFFFTRDFDLLDEAKYRVLIGMAVYSSIAQMVCFSF
jgi:hypothetical protein